MTHLTMDQLLALREPGSEPGAAAAREHVAACGQCAAELDRLHQRVARLRALPRLAPARNIWPAVEARRRAERRVVHLRRAGVGVLALAASLAGVAVVRSGDVQPLPPAVEGELAAVKESSRALERMLEAYGPEARVVDGRTAGMAQALEARIAEVDDELQAVGLQQPEPARKEQALELWRERVGLLDALVDVHVTHASNVGL